MTGCFFFFFFLRFYYYYYFSVQIRIENAPGLRGIPPFLRRGGDGFRHAGLGTNAVGVPQRVPAHVRSSGELFDRRGTERRRLGPVETAQQTEHRTGRSVQGLRPVAPGRRVDDRVLGRAHRPQTKHAAVGARDQMFDESVQQRRAPADHVQLPSVHENGRVYLVKYGQTR